MTTTNDNSILPPVSGEASPAVDSQHPAADGTKTFRTLKVRLKPTAQQEQFLVNHIGATKFAYNCAVAYWYAIHEQWVKDGKPKKAFVPSTYDLHAWWKRTKDGLIEGGETWLKETNQKSVRNGVSRARNAIKMFLSGDGKFPRFKRINESARWESGVSVTNNFISISRSFIPVVFHKRLPKDAKIVAVTVTRRAGAWLASILYETAKVQKNIGNALNGPQSAVGVDLGITTFATLSTSEKVDNQRPLKKQFARLRRAQRHLSRCQKGSNRRKRQKHKVAIIHAKVANTRLYHAQQLAFKLARDYQTICVEDLNVAGMVRNRNLARAVSDAGFSVFNQQLKWMCEKYHRNLVVIDRFYPSSKRCCRCGDINKELSLSDREWTCQSCFTHHDRDVNAAVNILHEGLTGAGKLRVNDVEGAEANPMKVGQVERSLNRQGRKAKNRIQECEVKETLCYAK